jgi:CHAT domain-containing protein
MRHVVAACVLALGVARSGAQIPPRSDSLQALVARTDPHAESIVRQYPDSARAAVTHLLALAAAAPVANARTALATAEQLASIYARIWSDSFFVRQVSRFERWSPDQRRAKATLDSVRVAGGSAFVTSGAAAAARFWRESLRLARSIGDSAGEGMALGNLGAAFYRDGALDSAEAYLNKGRTLAERQRDYRTLGNVVGTLASVAKNRDDLVRARALYTQALALRARTGDDRGAAADENNLGLIAQSQGDTVAARRSYQAALDRNRRAGRLTIAAENLSNLANLATVQGDYALAAQGYHDAVSIRRAAGERARLAPVLHNLGLLDMRRGDYGAARDALAEAVRIFDETGPPEDAITARTDLAAAQGAMGDLQSALTTLRRADSLVSRASLPEAAAEVALARADLAVDFNAFADAERGYTEAARWFGTLHDTASQADAQQGLGTLLLRRHDAAGARAVFDAVLRSRITAGDQHAIALTRLLLAEALGESGDTASARRELATVTAALRRLGDAAGEATALGVLADLELGAGRAREAQATYERGLARVNERLTPSVAADLHAGRARAMAAQGALDAAAAELRRVVDAIEHAAGGIRVSDARAGYRADKWDVYTRLALIERQRGHDAAAFEISERLRGRLMLDLLSEGRVAPVARTDTAVIVREQDLRRRIAGLELALEDERGADTVRGLPIRTDAAAGARSALDAAQREYAGLLGRVREVASDYGELVHPTTADPAAVAARLAPDQAFVEYLVTDSTTLAFVVRQNAVKAIDLHVGRHMLATAIDFTREAISRGPSGSSAELWRPPLRRLYRLLIEPIEKAGLLGGVRSLVIAPHLELHYLPFAALIASEPSDRFLVERFDIAYAPSASLWMLLSERNGAAHGTGVLAFAPRPDALPASRDEMAALRSVFGTSATVLTSSAATESALRERVANADIVHFATYGVLNKHNPLFSFIELAPDRHDDGHLAVHEVFGLQLRARLVVLSACQTALASGAAADVPDGDDWVGLVRAFLFAGADNVLATLWPVQDRSAASVMRTFYQRLAPGQSFPAALAAAQRQAIGDKRTADPAYWAAFTLVGAAR